MKHEESNEQIKVIDYCKAHKILAFSIPNGSVLKGNTMQRAKQMNQLKKEGLIVGVSDLVVMLDDKILFIEMKKKNKLLKNGSLSSAGISVSEFQLQFMDKVNKFSYAVATISYGAKEAIEFIDKHNGITINYI